MNDTERKLSITISLTIDEINLIDAHTTANKAKSRSETISGIIFGTIKPISKPIINKKKGN